MLSATDIIEQSPAATQPRCPVDHTQFKTQRTYSNPIPALSRDAAGIWQVHGFDEAKHILRYGKTRQLGFKAEFLERLPADARRPILYQEGPEHLEQRKQTAKFFSPKSVESYRATMERVAAEMVALLRRNGRMELRELSLGMAMRVVAEVVGMTASTRPGIEHRLDVFLREEVAPHNWFSKVWHLANNRLQVLLFFLLDVKPAIKARKLQPKDDLVSYLIGQNYKDWEIFTECVTYGAAGMVTTREFIGLALWHCWSSQNTRDATWWLAKKSVSPFCTRCCGWSRSSPCSNAGDRGRNAASARPIHHPARGRAYAY